MTNKPQAEMTIDDVRALVRDVRAEGLKIQSHYKKLEQEYSDWEDRVNELEKVIYQAEIDTGIKKEDIIGTKHLDETLSFLNDVEDIEVGE